MDDSTFFANRIHRMIKLGLSIDDDHIEEEDIPKECIGGNPEMSEIDAIQACIGKITEKSIKQY